MVDLLRSLSARHRRRIRSSIAPVFHNVELPPLSSQEIRRQPGALVPGSRCQHLPFPERHPERRLSRPHLR